MATYYRWRKSTANTNESQHQQTGNVISKNSNVIYFGNTRTNSNGSYTFNEVSYSPDEFPASAQMIEYDYFRFGNSSICYGSNAPNSLFLVRKNADGAGFSVSVHVSGFVLVIYTLEVSPGTSQGYVYSTNPGAYPNGGVSGSYYYDQRTTVTSPTTPTNLTCPNPITTPTVTVSWDAATSATDYPVDHYVLAYGYNNLTWNISNKTVSGTSTTVDIPQTYGGSPVTSIQFHLNAVDTNGQSGSAITSEWIPVLFAPTLTVPQMVMQGQSATISWSTVEGADSYTLQRKSSTDTDWTQVYSGANLTFSETVGTWTTVQYRVQAVFDGTAGGWAESAVIPVVSASSLVISGTDEDLGIITNDIPYSISTDTGNQITATITVNNAVIFSGNVGNSTADVIPVLDLITGEGTIVISATVEASGGPVTASRTWTYEKAAITFPNSGSVAQVTREGENIYPKVLAEGVRLPGGKTLDQVMGFPCQIYIGTKYSINNNTELEFPFNPKALLIFSGVAFGLFIQGANSGYCPIGSSSYEDSTVEWKEKSIRFVDSPFAANQTYTYVCFG